MRESGTIAEQGNLADVLITDRLLTRPSRTPDYRAESDALHELTRHLATDPSMLLQTLVETAVALCRADTAGLSIYDSSAGSDRLRWRNMAGRLVDLVGETIPREFSPCGMALQAGSPQLFDRPYRYFTYFQSSPAPLMEALVIPLPPGNYPAATIWIVAHDADRAFDSEDVRVMTRLASFTATVLNLTTTATENERLAEIAEQALATRDAFIATIAHDLKTPLTTLKGRSQLLARRMRKLQGPSIEQLSKDLAELPPLVERMANQIDELLDVTRLNAGQPLELQTSLVSATSLVEQCLADARLTTKQHVLQLVASRSEVRGKWDLKRVRRVIGNLLSNAIKYSPEGGTITIEIGREIIDGREWATIAVRDEGIGIAADHLESIFALYWRSPSMAHHVDGTGLGLSSSRHIIEMHGGTIAVTSTEDQGSTFTVKLPLLPDEA